MPRSIAITRKFERAPIPSLTGLRFVAAMSVAVPHGVAEMVQGSGCGYFWQVWISYFAAFGMSAFFVLSGFVIHYNYSNSILNDRWRGAANFFSARFARLYPLYFVCLMLSLYDQRYFFQLLETDKHPEASEQFWQLFPYFITLTQSWTYKIVGSNALVYGYPFSNAISNSWSVSTEFFFYLVYPFICFGLARLRRLRHIVVAVTVVVAGAFALLALAFNAIPTIDQFGIAHFGPIAGLSSGPQDSFLRWVIYFAPYSRLPEFLLGCLVAALYRRLEARPASPVERKTAGAIAYLSIAAIVAMTVIIALPSNPFRFLQFLHANFGFAVPVAALIFVLARYRTTISRVLSYDWIVRCGEASYSIYMLHAIVLAHAGLATIPAGQCAAYSLAASLALSSISLLRLVIALLVIIGISLVTYELLELPMRRRLRRWLTIAPKVPAADPAPRLT
jgi:peptidoglycan/LPS O-acetylase OafA/YrhL